MSGKLVRPDIQVLTLLRKMGLQATPLVLYIHIRNHKLARIITNRVCKLIDDLFSSMKTD